MYLVAGIMTIALLVIFFVSRSLRYPWIRPRALWLWFLLLLLAVLPTIRGVSLADGFNYYFNVLCCALIMFWLGTTIAHDVACIRHLLILLSIVGTFVAFVSIIQYFTGNLIFSSNRFDTNLALPSYFELFSGSGVHRVGAYFVYPNSNGAFLVLMICISIGLFVESPSIWGKVIYLIELFILLPALLLTYSTESWIAMGVGIITFIILAGRNYYRILISMLIIITAIFMIVFFPTQLDLLNQHTISANDLSSRSAAWQTGIAVIRAFPLTGLGLGYHIYVLRADPYRVWAQTEPLNHPHNSFIELTALGGIPVSIVFVFLLFFTILLALRNWTLADARVRALIGTGIATALALTSFSMSDTGWTLPPVLAISWLILGAISSPCITKNLREVMKKKGRS
jgi:putative inorganic carbon (HCO3(-)) transporter